ncbi:DMT family transporter [Luteococcus sp. OSA5]|uniref:DMT family transporter n=1 Tax=Luteococcus sp. OSA5 TaxID=3401630 RepID=UPI003B430D29
MDSSRAHEASRTASRPLTGGALFALAGACLWGTTGTSQALLQGDPSPVSVGALRAMIAAVTLTLLALATRPRAWLAAPREGRGRWLLAAGVAVAAYQLTFFAAVARTGVTVGTLVMLATAPAVAGMVGWAMEGLRPGRIWVIATLVSLGGATLLVLGAGSSAPLDGMGLALAIAAGASFALYSVAGRRAASAGTDTVVLTSWIFLAASAVLAWPLLGQDLAFVAEPHNLLVLAWLGFAATAGAYLLYQKGMRSIDAATAATLALAEPLVANLLAVAVLGEPFTWLMGLGVALVIGGLGLLSRA